MANGRRWLIAVAGMVRENPATEPGGKVSPREARATSVPAGCSSVETSHLDTASRVVRGASPRSADATGDAIGTDPVLRAVPMRMTGLLGTAIVGVMLVRETVTG